MSGGPLPSSFDGNSDFYEENRWQKLTRRFKEEPLIPLGCVLTCFALLGATRSIRAGDHNRTQRMFRARIAAQGFTLVAMVAGSMYWDSDRKKRKEFDAAVAEKKAKEKNEAWIRELEARDEEAKEIRAAREKRIIDKGRGLPEEKGAVLKAVEKSKATAKKAVGKENEETSSKSDEEKDAQGQGVLGSVQNLVWGKK